VIVVPYCTADVYGGTNSYGQAAGHPRQRFVGRHNLRLTVEATRHLWEESQHVLFAGLSAGGYGVLVSGADVVERMAPVAVDIISDCAALPTDTTVLSPYIQRRWRTLWQLVEHPDCGKVCYGPDGSGLAEMFRVQARAHPSRRWLLTTAEQDQTIRSFFAHNEACEYSCGALPPEDFERGVYSMRSAGLPPNVGTFFRPGTDHCFIGDDSMYEITVAGQTVAQAIEDMLRGVVYHTPE
jgi:hypothetical protein